MKMIFTAALLALDVVQNSSHSQTAADSIACGPPWFIVSPPSLKVSGSTIAVVPTLDNLNESKAIGVATFVYRDFNHKNRWKQLHVYVFKDKKSAQFFAAYQVKNQQQLLKTQDYKNLAKLWPHVLVRYSYSHGKKILKYPHQNPTNWWAKP